MFTFNIKSRTILGAALFMFMLLSIVPDALAQAPKHIWSFVYNSDGSTPANGDITIRVYLQKNPGNVITTSNTANGWEYDINNAWSFFPNPSESTPTSATVDDVVVIEFENTGSSAHNGESSVLTGALDENMYQQIGNNNFALPVELSHFSATEENGAVVLNWATATETINLGFNVYRSEEGMNQFQKINDKIIAGHGTSAEKHTYSFTDNDVTFSKTFEYKLENINADGTSKISGQLSITIESQQLPSSFSISQNYPNPFNPTTSINYSLPRNTQVNIIIYNTLGEVVKELVNSRQDAGSYTIMWDGYSDLGNPVASGMYFYEIKADNFNQVKKMTLSR
ncbi:MAG TPA: FlgD immunoglobulin-like domain containing protein [bacterium]|nr:FlgD immunoglobulin-like domain containing protein [bacterium]HPN45615.1 FlgD immunoglobulin-like domain containing protein [bacterium]